MNKTDIKSLTVEELENLISDMGQPKFRAAQIFKWLQSGVTSFEQMTDIPLKLRQQLEEGCYIASLKIVKKLKSKIDGTVKYLYELQDGNTIESVLMKYEHGYSLCISTQVGCRMGCSFCATGLGGLVRNLTASEMLAQITTAQLDENIRVSNVVMMGMGEPLDNFENSVRFLQLVSNLKGVGIGLRHISLSTCGVVSGIEKLKEYKMPITLSVSLHAPFDDIRSDMMRINNRWKIDSLLKACRDYQRVTTRRISFEYALIEGVNDTKECADALANKLKGIMCHINLIPVNPVKENQNKSPDRHKIIKFKEWLEAKGLNATIRRTLGADINASCGQLRRREQEGESHDTKSQN